MNTKKKKQINKQKVITTKTRSHTHDNIRHTLLPFITVDVILTRTDIFDTHKNGTSFAHLRLFGYLEYVIMLNARALNASLLRFKI